MPVIEVARSRPWDRPSVSSQRAISVGGWPGRTPTPDPGSQALLPAEMARCMRCRPQSGRGQVRVADLQVAACGSGDRLDAVCAGTHDQVVAADGPSSYAHVHDVAGRGAGGERAHRAGLAIIERLDVTSGQQPGQLGLAPATPGPRHHRRGHSGNFPPCQQRAMPGPHAALPPAGRNQRTRVIRDAHHALRSLPAPLRRARATVAATHSSASASSPAVNPPCSCPNPLTPASPARTVNSLRAVSASHAL